ncbi:hypothetical protein GlitD10_1421 [Gloeomargarita lithophora Alchichica-D10]|uniref:Uncharacterized protein n=1 Tax=Gloeomargarita lithophora Alchichica-D10 TaxID=1188229 RepID=A0A1J0ACT0_9CYAN|nr:hypothetical protein [Gloeomargarita lithophora]APB33742.1 hypothetical protein GlitD10_1421 [Gloeomargarita lithophora Alchichica-D10]
MPAPPNPNDHTRIQREIRAGRPFSLAAVIAQEGSTFLQGESPVPPLIQARIVVNLYIKNQLVDAAGALKAVLQQWVNGDEQHLSKHLNHPLNALVERLGTLLNNPFLLTELVREVDCEWGRIYGQKPYFQKPGQPPHPDDPYTDASVRAQLHQLLTAIQAQKWD